MMSKQNQIYETANGYKVNAFITREKATLRQSVEIIVISPFGEISTPTTVTRQQIICSKNAFDFLYNIGTAFTFDDIEEVKKIVHDLVSCKFANTVETQDHWTLTELYDEITQFISRKSISGYNNGEIHVFVEGNYGFLDSFALNDFVHTSLGKGGYKRTDTLKYLKLLGILQPDTNRVYDTQIHRGNIRKRYYKILLSKAVLPQTKNTAKLPLSPSPKGGFMYGN